MERGFCWEVSYRNKMGTICSTGLHSKRIEDRYKRGHLRAFYFIGWPCIVLEYTQDKHVNNKKEINFLNIYKQIQWVGCKVI